MESYTWATHQRNEQVVDEKDGGLAEEEWRKDTATESHEKSQDQRLGPKQLFSTRLLNFSHLTNQAWVSYVNNNVYAKVS